MSIYKVKIAGQYNATTNWSTGFHCESTVAESTINASAVSAWSTLWNDATNGYKLFTSAAVTTTFISTSTLNPSLRLLTKTSQGVSLAGTGVGNLLPLNIAPLLCFTGAQDTKSDRGRMRLPVVLEAEWVSGVWLAAFLTSLGTVFQTFWTTLNGNAGFKVTTYNRLTNKQGEAPFTSHPLPNWNIPSLPGTARQRTRKLIPTRATAGTT